MFDFDLWGKVRYWSKKLVATKNFGRDQFFCLNFGRDQKLGEEDEKGFDFKSLTKPFLFFWQILPFCNDDCNQIIAFRKQLLFQVFVSSPAAEVMHFLGHV